MTTLAGNHARILSHSQLFRDMPPQTINDLVTHGRVHVSKKDEALLVEEGRVSELFIVLEGCVQVLKIGGTQVTQLGRGNFFGEISVFGLAFGATATVTAPQGCTVFRVSRGELEAWFRRHPSCESIFLRHLATELCSRLYSTTEKLAAA